MKKIGPLSVLSIALNIMLISALVYFVTLQSDPLPPAPPLDCEYICMNYSESPSTTHISGDLALQMAGYYQDNMLLRTEELPISEDAASVWFSLEDLKSFIWQIESKINCEDCDSLNLGVRIYYARYPKELRSLSATEIARTYPDLERTPRSYASLHTVFMVPTFDDPTVPGDETHFDFYLDQDFTSNCLPKKISTKSDSSVTVLMGKTKNHGTLCPPVCGESGAAAFIKPR